MKPRRFRLVAVVVVGITVALLLGVAGPATAQAPWTKALVNDFLDRIRSRILQQVEHLMDRTCRPKPQAHGQPT